MREIFGCKIHVKRDGIGTRRHNVFMVKDYKTEVFIGAIFFEPEGPKDRNYFFQSIPKNTQDTLATYVSGYEHSQKKCIETMVEMMIHRGLMPA